MNRMKEMFIHIINYPEYMANDFIRQFWHNYICPTGIHLFDECQSVESHYLVCDACELMVYIDKNMVEKSYEYMNKSPYNKGSKNGTK